MNQHGGGPLTATLAQAPNTTTTAPGGTEATISPRPTQKEVLAVLRDYGIKKREATAFLKWMRDDVIPACRSSRHKYYFVTDKDIERHYDVLDLVMPHGERRTPGSPHDLVERHLLDPAMGEVALTHDMRRNGRIEFCSIGIDLTTVASSS